METTNAWNRPRPVIELAGTPFYVDAQWLYLFEVGNAENRIDMGEVHNYTDRLELWYDPTIKNSYQGSHTDSPPDHVLIYRFHSFDALDPTGAAARLDELNPEWRVESDVKLPIAEIGGRYFFVDKTYSCFYEVNNCWNAISFSKISRSKKIRGIFLNMRYHNTPLPNEISSASKMPFKTEPAVFTPITGGYKVHKIIKRYLRRNK